jgi:D-alanyl-D-alanine carboxypeptidase
MRIATLALSLVMVGCAADAPNDDVPGDDVPGDDVPGDDECADLPVGDGFAAELATAVAANALTGGGGILRIECASGGLLWEGAAGDTAVDSGVALRAGDAFEIQSTTKALTAALALTFVEDGSIGLDDPVSDVLPAEDTDGLLVIGGHDYGPELTLRQLLAHTAGLPDYWNDGPFGPDGLNDFQRDYLDDPDRVFAPRELIAYAKRLAPIARPDVRYHYCDTGYVLAGLVIEALGGAPFHQVMRDRILAPLGMDRTYLRYRETPTPEPLVAAWYDEGELVAGVLHQTADWAGGGLVSTAADLAVFMRALVDGRVVRDPATLAAMRDWIATDDDGIHYGLGLFQVDFAVFDDPERGAWEGHDGYGGAFMYAMDPQLIVTGTLNSAQSDWGVMVEAVQTRLLGR